MPRYFIESDDDDRLILDEAGVDLDDDGAARIYALAALPDMARDKIPDGDHRIFSVAVRDATGRIIYRASLTMQGEWYQRKH